MNEMVSIADTVATTNGVDIAATASVSTAIPPPGTELWDSHCHLFSNEFDCDRLKVLEEATRAGVTDIVVVSTDTDNAIKCLEGVKLINGMRASHGVTTEAVAATAAAAGCDGFQEGILPRLHLCIGIHPWCARMTDMLTLAAMARRAAQCNCHLPIQTNYTSQNMSTKPISSLEEEEEKSYLVGIGEVGLDRMPKTLAAGNSAKHRDPTAAAIIAEQAEVLRAQIELAKELNLPLNVHSACAGHHTIDLLRECGARRVFMHAFDGKAKYAVAAAESELDWAFGVPPCVVRSPQTQKLVRALPLRALLLETDSPALAPVKGPGVRNVPANLGVSLRAVADLKGLTVAEAASVLAANARRLWLGEQ